MTFRKSLQTFFVAFSLLVLAGCATHGTSSAVGGQGANAASAPSDDDVQTYGLSGSVNSWDGLDTIGPRNGELGIRRFYFAFDSNTVNTSDYDALKAHADYLIAHPSAHILLAGNTDSRGSSEYNIGLGQRRADAVAAVLESDGVPAQQIRTISYGAEKPWVKGNTEAQYKWNRRVDLIYEAV